MERQPSSRGLELATAIALGLVSLVTALGVLQASTWNTQASRYLDDSSDARDQSITISVTAQLKARADGAALIDAQHYAELQDVALSANDLDAALAWEIKMRTTLGNAYYLPPDAFDNWREAGFPADGNPVQSSDYLVESFGPADALTLASQQLGDLGKQLMARAAIFGQAALVHALALFLFGVAGINRLRVARSVTLGVGAAVFVFGLFLMSTAY